MSADNRTGEGFYQHFTLDGAWEYDLSGGADGSSDVTWRTAVANSQLLQGDTESHQLVSGAGWRTTYLVLFFLVSIVWRANAS